MQATPTFGESAMALDVVMQLLLDLLVQRDRNLGLQLMAAIDDLLTTEGPTPGVKQALANIRRQIEEAVDG